MIRPDDKGAGEFEGAGAHQSAMKQNAQPSTEQIRLTELRMLNPEATRSIIMRSRSTARWGSTATSGCSPNRSDAFTAAGVHGATVIISAVIFAPLSRQQTFSEYRFYPFHRKFRKLPSLAARNPSPPTSIIREPRDVRRKRCCGNQRRSPATQNRGGTDVKSRRKSHNGSWEHPGDNLSRGDIDDARQRGTQHGSPAVRCVSFSPCRC